MKTLMILTGGLGTGGLERISCFIANTFIEKGWKVVIITLLQTKDEQNSFQSLDDKVDVIPFCGNFNPLIHKIRAIKHWKKMIRANTKKYNPDSILAMTFKVASMVCLFAPKYAYKVTIREISDPKSKVRNQLVNKLTEFLCRKAKGIIFQTEWERSCYGKKTQAKGVVIPNPLSISVERRGLYNKKKVFTLSRLLLNQKRQDILIKGFELFHEQHRDYVLEIIGKGEDEKRIREMIANTKCKEFIHIIKPEPNIHKKVMDYRCFVLTSDFEGMSNALLECYSLGIPCISSDWPGVEDVVTNNFDGLLYKRQNIKELSNQLSRIADDDELCFKITEAAIINSKKFNTKDIIGKYCEVIERE